MLSTWQITDSVNNVFKMILVWGLIGGTLLSYVPQYYRLYKNKKTIGISETMLIFGIFSSFFNVLGSIQENLKYLSECGSKNNCNNVYIPITQLFSPFLCALIFYSFYLYYHHSEEYFNSYTYFRKFIHNRTKFRAIKKNDIINLELPLKNGQDISGHICQGHVDFVSKVKKIELIDKSYFMKF